MLDGIRAGRSAALVLVGEAGVGKSALVADAVDAAADLRVARAVGVESEMELPFAALHQLCRPLLDHLDRLPGPQRAALATAFGLEAGPVPDRFLVGLAVLGLLSEAALGRPLVCVLDDAQWLDRASAQALAFAARRVLAESVLVLFAARHLTDDLLGLPLLTVEGLADADARNLLDAVVPWPLDARVRERIVAETHGNPLALIELPRDFSAAELASGFEGADRRPLSGRVEESFRRRAENLPRDSRLLLLVAAAEPVGDSTLVWRAAERLGLSGLAADSATAAGLAEFGTRTVFRHPLVRSAAYRGASQAERRRVHAALAHVTDPDIDPDRRAWHLAQASDGPDEAVAAELERSAGRAQRRGGLASAAAFLERAAQLSADPARRTRRALAAAQANHLAGAPDAALRLLATADAGPLNEVERATVDLLRAEIAYLQNRGSEAPSLLLRAARRLEPLDPVLARQTHLDALWATHFAGRLARGTGLREAAEAALAAPRPTQPPRASDLLLDGLATAAVDGYAAAAPTLKQAVRAFRRADISAEDELRWLWHAGVVAMDLWDDESFDVLSARHVQVGREAGALAVLPIAYSAQIFAYAFAGRLDAAAQLIDELRTVTDAIGGQLPPYGPMLVAAWRGREAQATALIDPALADVTARGEGAGVAVAEYARAVLYNGLARYEDALAAATASDLPELEGFTVTNMVLLELIEAAVRTGATEQAADAFQRLAAMTAVSGTDWALGIQSRSQALLHRGAAAEACYREAIERFDRTRIRTQSARARLLYGEWLRRENRRVDAREQLRSAHERLVSMGADGYAERARRELLATGEVVRKRSTETVHDLTAQEAQIARLASQGRTNPEIGAQLFISARTVEWHLRKVFGKLGVTSRKELGQVLPDLTRLVQPA